MFDWLKRLLFGEPPVEARFDLLVDQPLHSGVQLTPAGERTSWQGAPNHLLVKPNNVIGAVGNEQPAGRTILKARAKLPSDLLARQTPDRRQRLIEIAQYRDQLQTVLDSDWDSLSRQEIYIRALEGYRWLELLERKVAEDPDCFEVSLGTSRETLERFVEYGRPEATR